MNDNAIGALAIVCIFGLPIVGWIVVRTLQFIERLEMIKRGIPPPPSGSFGFGGRRAYREWQQQFGQGPYAQQSGAQWSGQQWGPQPVPPPAGNPWACGADGPQAALFKGIRVATIGFALTIGLGLAFGGYRGNPVILAGLIPLFVGIAQIIVAVLSGAQFPGLAPRVTFIPPPPGAGAPPPRPGAAGNGAWSQPGRPHVEELSKPVQPPDVR
ncbi:MAG TPA: hypothetical protein VFB22_17135 [Candidatus Baltobacteraceae bacterium]|nr:hypothetical protein [Candidatus Baltobacteraceae bacterium]